MLNRFGRKDVGPATDLLVKASHFELEIKADGEPGEIVGYGSVWDKVDSYGEVVVKGKVTVEPVGDKTNIEYSTGIVNEVRRQLGQYRERRSAQRTLN